MSSANMPKMAYSDRKKKKKKYQTRQEQADKMESDYQKKLKKRNAFKKGRESARVTASN